MMRRLLMSVLAVVVAVGLAVGVSFISPLRRPPAQTVELVRSTKLVCLPSGQAMIAGENPITMSPVGDAQGTATPAPVNAAIAAPTIMSSTALIFGGVQTAQPSRGYLPCTAPLATGMLQVLDPASSELLLVNTDANEAVVDLTLLGADGEISTVGARGIAIAPGASQVIALSVLAPSGPVGVSYTTTQGRVSALARPIQGRNAVHAGTSTPETSQVIGGIPAAATEAKLVLSNPNEDRLDVKVEAIGSSTYEPATAANLTLAPKTTLVVDLASSLGGEASAIRVSSDEALGASVIVGPAGTQSSLTADEVSHELGVFVANAKSVQVTNPGPDAYTATVTAGGNSVELQVPAGTTVASALDLSEAGEVRVKASGPVLASLVSSDGAVVYPLAPTTAQETPTGVVASDPSLS